MTSTKCVEKSAYTNLLRLVTVFREHFTPTRNIHQRRGEQACAKQKPSNTPEKPWKNYVYGQDCDFENIIPTELIFFKI